MSRARTCAASLLAAATLVLVAACAGGNQDGSGGDGSASGAGETTLSIAAASSLTESFTTLATRFEKDHPGVTVQPVFESSGTAVDQVVGGAPIDVLATADAVTMRRAEDEGVVAKPVSFASNTMVLATPPDNPGGITAFSDVADPSVTLVLCDPSAPCGDVAAKLLSLNHVDAKPASLEPDVKSVLTKVSEGEADAGMVYVTDAQAAGSDVATVPVPNASEAPTPYLIGVVKGSEHAALSQDWVDLVRSAGGQRLLERDGFGGPM